MPPFAMQGSDGRWHGLSFDLLELVAIEMGCEYQVQEFADIKEMMAAVSGGSIDLIPALAAREEIETVLDLTQPYYRSGLSIATSRDEGGRGWRGFFRAVEFGQFLWLIASLLSLWLLAGAGVWLFERHRNSAMFGGSSTQGLGHGIWWAAVTMTTVGYGDKAPLTLGGRVIGVIWMFASIILLSSFTASISASLTADKLVGKVRGVQDLPRVRVATIDDTAPAKWLKSHGIATLEYSSPQTGLQAIVDDEIDAFVFDEAVLKNVSGQYFAGQVFVLPGSFEHYYVTMAVANNSPLRESINRFMLRIMVTDEWSELLARHTPKGH